MRHLTASVGHDSATVVAFGFYFTEMTVCTVTLAFGASTAVEK